MIAEAEGMLTTLAEDIAEYGGQPISVEPLPPAQPAFPRQPSRRRPRLASWTPRRRATDTSEPMPAVHVTPIPVEVTPNPVAGRRPSRLTDTHPG